MRRAKQFRPILYIPIWSTNIFNDFFSPTKSWLLWRRKQESFHCVSVFFDCMFSPHTNPSQSKVSIFKISAFSYRERDAKCQKWFWICFECNLCFERTHTHTHIYTKLAWARKRTPQKKLELNTRRIQRPMKFKQLFAEKSLECKTIKQHHFTSFNAHHYFPFALCALQGRICFRFAFFSAIIKSNQQTQTKEYEQVIVYKYKTDGGMWVWMGAIALKLEVPKGNDNTSSLNSCLERFSALSIGKRSDSHWIKLQLTFAACYPPFALLLWAAYLYCYKMISLKFIKRHENNIYSNIHIAYTRIA